MSTLMDLVPNPDDKQIVGYLLDYWRLHPAEWADMNDVDDTHEYRRVLHQLVNAATDGDLGRLVSPSSPHWVWLVGLAVAEATRLETQT